MINCRLLRAEQYLSAHAIPLLWGVACCGLVGYLQMGRVWYELTGELIILLFLGAPTLHC